LREVIRKTNVSKIEILFFGNDGNRGKSKNLRFLDEN
jgi:hypothetical protein